MLGNGQGGVCRGDVEQRCCRKIKRQTDNCTVTASEPGQGVSWSASDWVCLIDTCQTSVAHVMLETKKRGADGTGFIVSCLSPKQRISVNGNSCLGSSITINPQSASAGLEHEAQLPHSRVALPSSNGELRHQLLYEFAQVPVPGMFRVGYEVKKCALSRRHLFVTIAQAEHVGS
jgi:hypothetical protein